MDLNFVGATPATAENHRTSNCTNTTDFDEALENILGMDLSEFDLSLFDIPLPLSSQQPVTGEMPIDLIPAPAQPPQLPSFSEVSENVNLIGMNSALPARGRTRSGKSVLDHRRDSNRLCLGSGSSAPSSYKKRAVIPPEKLAELEIADPKKAQRIIANRIAAKKSKEKKKNYEKELEKRVELLQAQADNVTAERMMAMNEAIELAAKYKRVKDLIQSKLQHQEQQRAVMKLMEEEANILKMQIHEMNTAMADLSFAEPVSQSQLQVPRQTELYIQPQPQPPLVPLPPSPFGEPLLPPPPPPFGEPLLPPPPSPFGEPFSDHFIGTSFSNCNPWN